MGNEKKTIVVNTMNVVVHIPNRVFFKVHKNGPDKGKLIVDEENGAHVVDRVCPGVALNPGDNEVDAGQWKQLAETKLVKNYLASRKGRDKDGKKTKTLKPFINVKTSSVTTSPNP